MDLLPKHMCHRCSYKLEEFHKFYVDCLKTDAALKNQLSWMQKGRTREKTGVPMVHIENVNIKTEPLDYDVYELEPIVDNIDYINSMANSVAFPAGRIHEGLTYAAFSRCRCCCDKKDQSRRKTAAELCRNYKESVARCGGIANDSRRRTLEDARAGLRPARKKTFAGAVFQDRPKDHLLRVNAADDARVRLLTAETKNVSSLNTRNRSHDRLGAAPESRTASRSTIVRNLRPRKNLVSYAPNKKRMPGDIREESSTESKSYVVDLKTTPASDHFMLARQIKVEQIDETMEGRSLRPRKNVVDYYGPKTKKGLGLAYREQRKGSELAYRARKRKIDEAQQSSQGENASNGLKREIKQEIPDTPDNAVLREITGATSMLPKSRAKIITELPAIEALTTNADATDYLKPSQPQVVPARSECQPIKQKPIVANLVKNNLAKSKKMNRSSTANYSPKCLRSQDVRLRSGKRKYVDWSMKESRTGRKLMEHAVAKDTKKVPAVLKLAKNIKNYCELCNMSFMTTELFRLHECYFD